MTSRPATMKDVAQRAGVSIQTVSYVVNDTGSISASTRARVLDAINELNYRPDVIARSMRTRRTQIIGLLVLDITNPVHSRIAHAVESTAHARGYRVILYNISQDPDRERECLEASLEGLVDGLIIVNSVDRERTLEFLQQQGTNAVLIDSLSSSDTPSVMVDNLAAAYAATAHLIELGHRRIAHIAGWEPHLIAQQRVDGYRKALTDHGLEYVCIGKALAESWSWDFRAGYEGMQQILASSPEAPTAVFAASDQMAIGAYRAIAEAGLRIPDDVSVVGFDNLEIAGYTVPSLTTIHQPFEKMATNAVKLLLRLIKRQRLENPQEVLPFELIVRGSTKAIRHDDHSGAG